MNAIERIREIAQETDNLVARRAALAAMRCEEAHRQFELKPIKAGRLDIEVLSTHYSGKVLELLARAYLDGKQLGFGRDGSIDIERFVIVNPPLLVPDPAGDQVRRQINQKTAQVNERRYRFDPREAAARSLIDTVLDVGKFDGMIIPGRVGQTTYTIFGQTGDGYVASGGNTYATVRGAGSSVAADTTDTRIYVGQNFASPNYQCFETFVSFDTSSVVGEVSSATLSLYGADDGSVTDFSVVAARNDWDTLTAADWVAGDSLAALTTLATLATSGFSASGYNSFASAPAFLSNINPSGITGITLYSSRQSGSNTPTGIEYVGFFSADQSGTTNDPRLVVEAAAASSWVPRIIMF